MGKQYDSFVCIYCAEFKCSYMHLCIEYLSHLIYIHVYTFACNLHVHCICSAYSFYTLISTLNFILGVVSVTMLYSYDGSIKSDSMEVL